MHLSTSFLSQNNFNAMMMPSVQVPNQQQCSFGVQFPNNHMFSSSYPLNNFYRQQPPAVNSTFTYENDPRFSYEPTKRVKINNESERIIPNNIHAQLSPQTIQTIPVKQNYNYRAPNVSSRLPLMKGQHNMELLNQINRQNVEVNQRDNKEPLMIPELTTEAFNDLYNKKIESIQEELEIQKKLYLHHVIKGKIKESAKWLRSVKENSKKDQGTKSAEDTLQEEYITRQIKQNILPLLKLCKKNQEDLAQYLKTPIPELKNQNYLNKPFEKLEADTITFDINIKQESPY